jgi:hypothetical protein
MAGKVYVTSGLGGMSGAQAKAAVICGAIGVIAEVSCASPWLGCCVLSHIGLLAFHCGCWNVCRGRTEETTRPGLARGNCTMCIACSARKDGLVITGSMCVLLDFGRERRD